MFTIVSYASGNDSSADEEDMPYARGQEILHSQLIDEHPDISLPKDFEHFLHVGSNNLGAVNVLCRDQQKSFDEVVARRVRRLPKPPDTPLADEKHTNRPAPKFLTTTPSTPRTLSRQASSSSNSSRGIPRTPSVRLFRNFLRGDTPRRKGKEDIQIAIQEAIEAIEQNHIQRLSELLESESVDANACDNDGHTLLDLAVMLNQVGCAKLLQLYGGVETEAYGDPKVRERRLEVLLRAKQIALGKILDDIKAGARNLYQEHEENRILCERSVSLYRKWYKVFRSAGKPAAPSSIKLTSSSSNAITVQIGDVLDHGGAVVTKFKVLWSDNPSFQDANHIFIPAVVSEFTLTDLPQSQPCYVRAASCNMTGTGPAIQSTPPFLVPSSWREIDGLPSRLTLLETQLDNTEEELSKHGLLLDSRPLSKKFNKSSGSSIKLTKPTKRGLYLAGCIFDRDNPKTVLSNFGTLPCVLIDDDTSTHTNSDGMQFIQMLSFSWRIARYIPYVTGDVSSLVFRRRVGDVVTFLQQQTGVTDLGYLYYQPVIEECGATVLVVSCGVSPSEIKSNLSWSQTSSLQDGSNLTASIMYVIDYAQGCLSPISSGLHLASVFPHNTVNGLRISTPKSKPNFLPYLFLRSSQHVSKDEWMFFRRSVPLSASERSGTATHGNDLAQHIVEAVPKLLSQSSVAEDNFQEYRLYTPEVIELSSCTSLVVLVPDTKYSLETVAVARPQAPSHITLSSKSLELLIWGYFQPEAIQRYTRLWISATTHLLSLRYSLRKVLGAEAAGIQSLLQVAEEAVETLDQAWQHLQLFSDLIRWCKNSSESDEPKTLSFADLKKKVRLQPETPQQNDVNETPNRAIFRLSTNIQGKGLLTVYAQSPDDNEILLRHKIQVPHMASASLVVKALMEEMQSTMDNEDVALCLVSHTGKQKRIAEGCRPLLMQAQWEDEQAKLVLITR